MKEFAAAMYTNFVHDFDIAIRLNNLSSKNPEVSITSCKSEVRSMFKFKLYLNNEK